MRVAGKAYQCSYGTNNTFNRQRVPLVFNQSSHKTKTGTQVFCLYYLYYNNKSTYGRTFFNFNYQASQDIYTSFSYMYKF
jgi:hypothetical protein